MRGKAGRLCAGTGSAGITPAYAGKSSVYVFPNTLDPGSPPPMRGKVPIVVKLDFSVGITPAYAGKSPYLDTIVTTQGDHPRLCGEKTKKIPKQRYFFHQLASFSFSLQYT